MRTILPVLSITLGLLASPPPAAGGSPDTARVANSREPVRGGWPDTRAGVLGWRWVQAFNAGPAAMRRHYDEDLAASSRAERSVETRLARYAELRERFGRLTLASVVRSDSVSVRVKLFDADLAPHTFEFRIESKAPWKLVTVSMFQAGPGGHGGMSHP